MLRSDDPRRFRGVGSFLPSVHRGLPLLLKESVLALKFRLRVAEAVDLGLRLLPNGRALELKF